MEKDIRKTIKVSEGAHVAIKLAAAYSQETISDMLFRLSKAEIVVRSRERVANGKPAKKAKVANGRKG